MDLNLKDVHVLVTGASGGIGLETASLFLEQGARVTAHYNSKAAPLKPVLDKWGKERVLLAQADLVQEDAVAKLFSEATLTFGTVQNTFDANVTSSFLVAREYLRYLERATDSEKAKASIVIVGSSAGKYGEAFHAEYAATKSALMYGFTLSLKNEIVKIAPWGRVNCVAPGWVKTPMAEESLKDTNILYQALATYPLKKVAVPYDVATQIVILSSTKVSGHISGECLMVTGGMEGRLLNTREDLGL
ncbi:NAD(P)-binding protein [Mucidula mucida]|nr:NAD(P)-binding protein [Mucidula mucida]